MADPRERWNDDQETTRVTSDRSESRIWTAMPVKVVKDSDGHIVDLQITIKGWQRNRRGEMEPVEIAELGMCPVHFAAGGGLTATHPIKENDEGMAVFQARCIDGWWEKGGVQEEPYRRRHHLSDGMYVPGFRNKVRQLDPPPSKNSYQIRTDDGKYYVELTDDGVVNIYAREVNVHAPRINMDGNQRSGEKAENIDENDTAVEVKGTIHATGNIASDREVIAREGGRGGIGDQVSLATHRHTGVQAGGGISGPPQPGS